MVTVVAQYSGPAVNDATCCEQSSSILSCSIDARLSCSSRSSPSPNCSIRSLGVAPRSCLINSCIARVFMLLQPFESRKNLLRPLLLRELRYVRIKLDSLRGPAVQSVCNRFDSLRRALAIESMIGVPPHHTGGNLDIAGTFAVGIGVRLKPDST